jgi:hypothetical protein
MNIKEFERFILLELKKVVESIIKENLFLNISAKSRAGAEISDFLEDKFLDKTAEHEYFTQSESSPKGATKNPWDVRTKFKLKDHVEELWIDFKALKRSAVDSNPDIGTPDKIIKFIQSGNFYLAYIFVYYQEKEKGLEFVKYDGEYTKLYFLKDISATFRRNPKNQLQVNMAEPSEYRTREGFIKLLLSKIKESHIRQRKISEKRLKLLGQIEKNLVLVNKKSEKNILKKI